MGRATSKATHAGIWRTPKRGRETGPTCERPHRGQPDGPEGVILRSARAGDPEHTRPPAHILRVTPG
eukprot:4260781-Prymnesium_polylepis.2